MPSNLKATARIRVCSCLAVAGLLAGAAPILADPLVSDAALREAGLTRYWDARLPLNEHDSIAEGYLVDDALYVTTDGGTFFALKADVGLIRWAEKITAADFRIYEPTHMITADGTGLLIIVTAAETFVFDRFSGDRLQTFTPEFNLGTPPVGFDNTLFMGSTDGRVYALRLRTSGGAPVQLWAVSVGGAVTAKPILYAADKLLFASHSGDVFSCRAWDKAFDWRFSTGGAIYGTPALDQSGVYVASTDRSLYKVNARTGGLIWQRRFPCRLFEGPIAVSHLVYQFCKSVGLTAVDAASGEPKWRLPEGRAFVARAMDRDMILSRDHSLLVVDRANGEVLHRIHLPAGTGAAVNVKSDAVYLLGRDGRILCARPADVPYLRSEDVEAARQKLTLSPDSDADRVQREALEATEDSEPADSDPFRSRRDR